MRRFIGCFILLCLAQAFPGFSRGAEGPIVINVSSGDKIKWQDLLKDHKRILVVLSKDCIPRRQYVRTLNHCSPEIRARLSFLSVDSLRQAKAMKNDFDLPGEDNFFVLQESSAKTSVAKGTPTSYLGNLPPRIGVLDCQELQGYPETARRE